MKVAQQQPNIFTNTPRSTGRQSQEECARKSLLYIRQNLRLNTTHGLGKVSASLSGDRVGHDFFVSVLVNL